VEMKLMHSSIAPLTRVILANKTLLGQRERAVQQTATDRDTM